MNNTFVWLIMMLPLNKKWLYRRFYLRSAHWQKTRLNACWSAHWACQGCKSKPVGKRNGNKITISLTVPLDVHHRYYYRNGKSILWHERPEDLQVLCRTCHKKEHERKIR